jgi:hypothetical protein
MALLNILALYKCGPYQSLWPYAIEEGARASVRCSPLEPIFDLNIVGIISSSLVWYTINYVTIFIRNALVDGIATLIKFVKGPK